MCLKADKDWEEEILDIQRLNMTHWWYSKVKAKYALGEKSKGKCFHYGKPVYGSGTNLNFSSRIDG